MISAIVYGSLFLSFILSFFLNEFAHFKFKKIFALAIPLLLFYFILILKDNSVGTDTMSYAAHYEEIVEGKSFLDFSSDKGFYFLMYLCSLISSNFRIFQIVFYLLCFACLFFFFFKCPNNTPLSFFALTSTSIFAMSFSGLRQFGAICLCMLTFSLLLFSKKTIFKFLSIIPLLCAFTVHSSSIVFVLIYIFYFIRFKKFKYLFVFIAIYIFFFMNASTVHYVINIFVDLKYPVSSQYLGFPFKSVLLCCYFTCFYLLVFVSNDIFKNLFKLDDKERKTTDVTASLFLLFTSAIFFSFSSTSNIFTRFGFFFEIAIVYLFPRLFSHFKNQKIYICVSSFSMVFLLFISLYEIVMNPCGISSYKFFF